VGNTPKGTLLQVFGHRKPMLCIMPRETVARTLSAFILGRPHEPPVIVLDEQRDLNLSILGYPTPAALQLMERVGKALELVTLPTERVVVSREIDMSRIGRGWGWKLEHEENFQRIADAVAAKEPIAVYQDAGRRDWWQAFGAWPQQFERLKHWPNEVRWRGLIVISDRNIAELPRELESATLVFRPPTLTLGVASRRCVDGSELVECARLLFERHGLSSASLTAIGATASRKDDYVLADFAEDRGVPLLTYPADKLEWIRSGWSERHQRRQRIHHAGACEPAALLAAGVRDLLVPKTIFAKLALAVARRQLA
jgi:cobalamin biosynthesis protein CbiG